MDKPSKRGDKIPRKMTPEHLAWGRELGHATNTPVDDIDDSGDDDYQEFLRLSDACAVIENELKTVKDPEGASVAETKQLTDQRELITNALGFTKPDEARAALNKLKLMIVDIGKAITERKRKLKALKLQLADLVDLPELAKAEVAAMALIRKKADTAIESQDVDGATAAVNELDDALAAARASTDERLLVTRLREALDAKNKPVATIAYERCCVVGITLGAEKIALRQLGILQYTPLSANYVVDSSHCIAHIKERHTLAGIWDKRRLLTDHPTKVSIFASEEAMNQAIRTAPTPRASWWATDPGRIDTRANGVHYQANVLGEKASLFSCYPIRGYDKETVALILQQARSFEEFCEEISRLR